MLIPNAIAEFDSDSSGWLALQVSVSAHRLAPFGTEAPKSLESTKFGRQVFARIRY